MHCHAVPKKNENGGHPSLYIVESQQFCDPPLAPNFNWFWLIKQHRDLVIRESAGVLLSEQKTQLVHALKF